MPPIDSSDSEGGGRGTKNMNKKIDAVYLQGALTNAKLQIAIE